VQLAGPKAGSVRVLPARAGACWSGQGCGRVGLGGRGCRITADGCVLGERARVASF